jgi:6-phosphogluconolactonase
MRVTVVPTIVVSLFAAGGLSLAAQALPSAAAGMVYTMTNAASGNTVMAYLRAHGGQLVPAGTFPTGGMGTGAELGSEGGLVMSRNEQWLFAVNEGSNEISVFAVSATGLHLTDVVNSGGTMPVSVADIGPLVYVVNSGSDSIAGFALSSAGMLTPIAGSVQGLSGSGVGPAEIAFNPEGDELVVTEKNTNMITIFPIGSGGVAGPGHSVASSGMTPYGFAFAKRRQLFVSEAAGGAANASSVTSYRLWNGGTLQTLSASVKDNQTAACWVITDGGGRFVYTTNTGSNDISSYLVEFDGQMALFQSDAAATGAGPIDMALSSDGRLLYALNGGDGTISGYRVMADGRLMSVSTGVSGLPSGTSGLAAR